MTVFSLQITFWGEEGKMQGQGEGEQCEPSAGEGREAKPVLQKARSGSQGPWYLKIIPSRLKRGMFQLPFKMSTFKTGPHHAFAGTSIRDGELQRVGESFAFLRSLTVRSTKHVETVAWGIFLPGHCGQRPHLPRLRLSAGGRGHFRPGRGLWCLTFEQNEL